jgi:hypothetical protein
LILEYLLQEILNLLVVDTGPGLAIIFSAVGGCRRCRRNLDR